MIRHSLHRLALGTVALFAAGGGQAAASDCCACPAPCVTERMVEVVAVPATAPFYVVNEGPIYAGPGIMSVPTTYKKHQSIGAYPYIGRGYGHYHRHDPEIVIWQKSRVLYIDAKAPPRMGMSHPARMTPYRNAPRRLLRPLDPRDK
jgi:hypothetical protein